MSHRLRLALVIFIVAGISFAAVAEMVVTIFIPTLQWQRERVADRAAYARIAHLPTRTAVEDSLAGWKATTAPQPAASYCAALARLTRAPELPCSAADRALVYDRPHPVHPDPLQPLRIVVIYDKQDRVVATTTLD